MPKKAKELSALAVSMLKSAGRHAVGGVDGLRCLIPCASLWHMILRLIADIHHIFIQAVFVSLRRRAGLSCIGRRAKGGAVTFVQRFGDALNINVHFHTLALDDVYVEDDDGFVRFHQVGHPTNEEVRRIVVCIA
jgi:hypothetical protein